MSAGNISGQDRAELFGPHSPWPQECNAYLLGYEFDDLLARIDRRWFPEPEGQLEGKVDQDRLISSPTPLEVHLTRVREFANGLRSVHGLDSRVNEFHAAVEKNWESVVDAWGSDDHRRIALRIATSEPDTFNAAALVERLPVGRYMVGSQSAMNTLAAALPEPLRLLHQIGSLVPRIAWLNGADAGQRLNDALAMIGEFEGAGTRYSHDYNLLGLNAGRLPRAGHAGRNGAFVRTVSTWIETRHDTFLQRLLTLAWPPLQVDLVNLQVTWRGHPYAVTENGARFLQVLLSAGADFINGVELHSRDHLLPETHLERIMSGLPETLRSLVEPRPGPGGGYRLRWYLL